jgi:magnesium transporter
MDPSLAEMEELSRQYKLNHHTVRDCMQPQHLPKYEFVDDVHFLILRFYSHEPDKGMATIQEITDKIAIFYTDQFIITIHKAKASFLELISRKLTRPQACSSIIDVLIKIIWNALETFDDPASKLSAGVEVYESEVMLKKTSDDQMQALYFIKRQASASHKVLMLMSEPINHQHPGNSEMSSAQDMRDQHLKMLTLYSQILDDVNNLMNLSMSFAAKRTNEAMRVLTVFSVFFMPLTFIVGIYGMNFTYMPELNKKWGYPAVLFIMAIITVVIYLWFKRKKWL